MHGTWGLKLWCYELSDSFQQYVEIVKKVIKSAITLSLVNLVSSKAQVMCKVTKSRRQHYCIKFLSSTGNLLWFLAKK